MALPITHNNRCKQRAAARNDLVEVYRESAIRYRLLFLVTFVVLLCVCAYVFIDKYEHSVNDINAIVSKVAVAHVVEEGEVGGKAEVDDSSDVKQQQIENYRKGEALMINVHATHHAGTSVCDTIGRHGINNSIAPGFACMGDKDNIMPNKTYGITYMEGPWFHDETGQNIAAVRPYFHMISWEYDGNNMRKKRLVENTDWEHPKLVSVIITRDPISRLLAGDGITGANYPGYDKGTLNHQGWWDYAKDLNIPNTDNYFLRIVGGEKWHGEKWLQNQKKEQLDSINRTSYEHAASVLNHFTSVKYFINGEIPFQF